MPLAAQQRDTVVVAGARYARGGVYRYFFGSHYRELWTTPIRVRVLDLGRFAGGLRPTEEGGGMQTRSLRFEGGDGHEYRFRSVDKFPDLLPENLDGTFLDDIVRDQTRAQHPAAALVAGVLMTATGIPHSTFEMYVLPDDERLGAFREKFAGMLGLMERRLDDDDDDGPLPRSVEDIEDSDEVFPLVLASPENVIDARALLRARLVDLLMGDWDRHRGQWDWGRIDGRGTRRWIALPQDRDHAFVRFDGLLPTLARNSSTPQLVEFGPGFSDLDGTSWNGRDLDRWFLGGLGRADWDSISADVQARLTDSVIDSAVRAMPEEWRAIDGARMARALRERRDHLAEEARRFYRYLGREAEAHLTDAAERVEAERRADGTLELTVRAGDRPPHFSRLFHPAETREVRLYLRGGPDTVRVSGSGPARITLRVIGDRGATLADGSRTDNVHRYDADWRPQPAGIQPEKADSARPDTLAIPPPPLRDYGSRLRPLLWVGGGPDVGVFLGGGAFRTSWGFRKVPWASQLHVRGGWATQANTGRLQLDLVRRREASRARTEVTAWASGIEVLRWHGIGNESVAAPGPYNRVNRAEIGIHGRLFLPLARHMEIGIGPEILWADTRLQAGRIIADSTPYGADEFGTAGLRAEIDFDSRDFVSAPSRGFAFRIGGTYWPAIWSARKGFSEIHAQGSTYLTARGAPLRPTLALRAGGKRVFGRYPFAEAAFIGDASTVRLGRQNRFGGDAAAWGGAELRLALSRFNVLLPGQLGVHTLYDAGRVWAPGERSTKWHSAWGGGIWFSLVQPKNVVAVTVAQTRERTAFYVAAGFHY